MAYHKQEESKVQKQIQEYLKSIGAYKFKVHGEIFMRAGIPDIIACVKGRFVGIEVKDGNNKPSELQLAHRSSNPKIWWYIWSMLFSARC